jgi:hypothetical protein
MKRFYLILESLRILISRNLKELSAEDAEGITRRALSNAEVLRGYQPTAWPCSATSFREISFLQQLC